jgi:cyanophycinase
VTPGRRERNGRLFLIGGGERRIAEPEILEHFVRIAGGRNARILVAAAASRVPDEVLADYQAVFTDLGVAGVRSEPLQDRHACEDEELLGLLEESTAVFFTGGDQSRLTATVAGTTFGDRLRDKVADEGFLLAGTSAGASAMSSTMILGGPGGGTVRKMDVRIGVGLGLLPDAIIDTHFNERARLNRLLTVFAQNSQILGIGLDENTAIDVRLGHPFRVYGSGAVTILDGHVSYYNAADADEDDILALSGVRLHVLPRGYEFDPYSRELLLPDGQVA